MRFLYPDQCTRVRSVLGKSCESIRWGRTTVKGQVEGRTVDLLGWFQDNFREESIGEAENMETDSLKTFLFPRKVLTDAQGYVFSTVK